MKLCLGEISIAYTDDGSNSGLPVVFIHGFPFSKEMWKAQVEALKNEFRVITYDVRGHGESDVGDGQYSVEFFVDDLIGLMDHLKIGRAILVGLSMGGYIALRAIERHRDRFRALVLCDTRSEADGNEGKVRRAVQSRAVKVEGMKKFAEQFLQAVFYEKTLATNPTVVEIIRRTIERTSPIGAAGTLLALAARTDTTASLFNITVPTLILVGQHDSITPPSASHDMKEKIPYAELHIIRNAGHVSNLENSEEFNEKLLAFLQGIR